MNSARCTVDVDGIKYPPISCQASANTEYFAMKRITTERNLAPNLSKHNAFSTLTLRFQEEEEPEEDQQPLLSEHTRDSNEECNPKPAKSRRKVQKRKLGKKATVRGEKWKPRELAKGWKMQKKKVTLWAKSRRYRQSLRSGMKALSDCPLLLLKSMRDAYVSVMKGMERKCNQRMWHLAGARLL